MIKGIPTSDYLHFERLRKDNCARRIQRLWRNSSYGRKWEVESPLLQNKKSIYTTGYFNRNGVYIPNSYSRQSQKNEGRFRNRPGQDNLESNTNTTNNNNGIEMVIENNPILKEQRRMLLKAMTNDINVATIAMSSTNPSINASSTSYIYDENYKASNNANPTNNMNVPDNTQSNGVPRNYLCSQYFKSLRKFSCSVFCLCIICIYYAVE